MKKILRYLGFSIIGIFLFIMMVTAFFSYFNIGIADIITNTEYYITSIIQLWDIQQESETDITQKKNYSKRRLTKKMVHLYFTDEAERYLKVEDRIVSNPDSPTQLAHILLNALFDGPRNKLTQVLPKGDLLRAVYIDAENQTAYIDLKQTIVSLFPGGVTQELLAIYAMVNTLTLNVREIEKVKIIIGGQEANTLAGHLDIRYPYTTNMLIVR